MQKFNPHGYQLVAEDHVLQNHGAGLFLDMGLGKTVIMLGAIKKLIYEDFSVTRVLVVAPKRVAQTVWHKEASKWEHTHDLKVVRVLGTAKQRINALRTDADIYVINRELVPWLVSQYGGGRMPFDMLVIDELTSFKNHASQRFKALKLVRGTFRRIVGLTGSPAPNGLIDLWAQMYLLDGGQRLEKTVTAYRNTYFKALRQVGNVVYKYGLLPGAEDVIQSNISDICISMKTEDYISLPDCTHNYIDIEFPESIRAQYEQFERDQILEFVEAGIELTALNGAALLNKLLQFVNGAAYYDKTGQYYEIHDLKIQAVHEIIEGANGAPVLIAYQYEHDRERLLRELSPYSPVWLRTEQDVDDWNAGRIGVLITHPASAGHGLNLQDGGNHAIWFGETFNLELYQQFNKRLHRQGQKQKVLIHHPVITNSVDSRVISALHDKEEVQDRLINYLAVRIEEFKNNFRKSYC